MNYVDMALGTWYLWAACTGSGKMVKLAEEKGVGFKYEQPVTEIVLENGRASGIKTPMPITRPKW
jgi:phytoene desaturase